MKKKDEKMPSDITLKELNERIEEARKPLKTVSSGKKISRPAMAKFFNVGADLIAGVFVGVGMGLVSDWMFNIAPWGLIFFFILGSAAGLLNTYRTLISIKKRGYPYE